MHRLTDSKKDRGAVAVWVALLLVPLMIVAALAIDIGSANADRQRLQHGADAAALAIAELCLETDCDTAEELGRAHDIAAELATANAPTGSPAMGTIVEIDTGAGWVKTRSSSDHAFWFAPVIGDPGAPLAATSAATWSTGGGMPLAFSWCEILGQTRDGGLGYIYDGSDVVGLDITPVEDVVMFNKGGTINDCTSSDAKPPKPMSAPGGIPTQPPGGFGWLEPASALEPCLNFAMSSGNWAQSDTGNDGPGATCEQQYRDMMDSTEPLLIPVFDWTNGKTGNNAQYHILGYVSFDLDGFYFSNTLKSTEDKKDAPCDGEARCVSGDIGGWVDLETAQEMMGSVSLRLPEELG